MKDIPNKTDDIDVLPANAWDSGNDELKNIVTDSGQTLDSTPETVEDPNPTQISRAITMASQAAAEYRDTGTANAYSLARIGTWRQPTAYFDGMTVTFKAGTANTGGSTINVVSLGVKNLVLGNGTALSSGFISVDDFITAQYNLSDDRFEIVSAPGLTPAGLLFQDDGTPIAGRHETLNVAGAGASLAESGGVVTLTVSTPTLTVQNDGTDVGAPATTLNFGTDFTVTGTGAEKLIVFAASPVLPGTIVEYGGQTVPSGSGWLLCDGSTYNEADQPTLFAAIGRTFGGDAGANTFRVPDMRGQHPRGWDPRSAGDPGVIDPDRVFGSFQDDDIKSHFHVQNLPVQSGGTEDIQSLVSTPNQDETFAQVNQTEATGISENRVKTVALNYIIKT